MSERETDFLARWSRRKADVRDGGLQKKAEPVHKPGRMHTDPPEPKVIEREGEEGAEGDAEIALSREASLQGAQAPVEVPDGEAADAQAQDAEAPESGEPETGEPETGEEEDAQDYKPGEFDDVDFDKLNYASDYSRFMKNGVPEAIRKRALRMLWSSNPILANIDGLNDYDEDFTDAALAVKVLTSNYKPGLGYLTEEERIASYSEEARLAGPELVEEEPDEQDPDDMDVEDMDDDEPEDDTPVATASLEGDEDGSEPGESSKDEIA